MDILIDKFAQRKNAQELIKANYMAETEENNRLNAKVALYEETLQEIKNLTDLNKEYSEKMGTMLDTGLQKIAEIQQPGDEKWEAVEGLLTQLRKDLEEFNHKEAVKVYRNVQAVVEEENTKVLTELTEKMQQVTAQNKGRGVLIILLILTLLASLASVGINVAQLMGLL